MNNFDDFEDDEDEEDDENKRKDKDPFDDFEDDFFNEIFENIFNNIMDNEKLREDIRRMAEEMMKNTKNKPPGGPFVKGFKIDIDPEGKPHIKDLKSQKENDFKKDISNQQVQEPEPDIMEEEEKLTVTAEIPGVKKEDIDLNVSSNNVLINVNSPYKQYYKKLNLPSPVKPKTTKATYKNGILDLIIEKKKIRQSNKGFNINIE